MIILSKEDLERYSLALENVDSFLQARNYILLSVFKEDYELRGVPEPSDPVKLHVFYMVDSNEVIESFPDSPFQNFPLPLLLTQERFTLIEVGQLLSAVKNMQLEILDILKLPMISYSSENELELFTMIEDGFKFRQFDEYIKYGSGKFSLFNADVGKLYRAKQLLHLMMTGELEINQQNMNIICQDRPIMFTGDARNYATVIARHINRMRRSIL